MEFLDPEHFWWLGATDRILYILTLSIAVLFLFVVFFGIFTIAFRIKNVLKAKRWKHLESVWEPLLLGVLSRDEDPEVLHRVVRKPDRLKFVDFLMRYTQHFRGDELDVLRDIARPCLPLIEEQLHEKSSESRARAVNTLSTLGFHRYQDQIIEHLDDPSPLVAMMAARALTRKDRPELAEYVIKRLPRFLHWSVHYLSSMLAEVGQSIAPTIRKIFADTGYPSRTRAVCADTLRNLHDFTAAAIAAEILAKENDREVCAASLRLLGEVGLPEHLPVILAQISAQDFVIRAQACRALGNLGGKSEIPVLKSAIEDPEPWVAIQAAYALNAAGGDEVLKEIAGSGHSQSTLAQQVLDESTV